MAYLSTSNPNLWPPSSTGSATAFETLLSSQTISGSAANFAAVTIPQTHRRLVGVISGLSDNSGSDNALIALNADTTNGDYRSQWQLWYASPQSSSAFALSTITAYYTGVGSTNAYCRLVGYLGGTGVGAVMGEQLTRFTIENYTETSQTVISWESAVYTATGVLYTLRGNTVHEDAAAVTSLQILVNNGSGYQVGSSLKLFGQGAA